MKITAIILSLGLLLPAYATASGDHNHDHEAAVEAAPHGGILRNALPYKSEIVIAKENVKIYVYDKNLKPVDKAKLKESVKGELAFPKDKKKREVVFKYSGDAY